MQLLHYIISDDNSTSRAAHRGMRTLRCCTLDICAQTTFMNSDDHGGALALMLIKCVHLHAKCVNLFICCNPEKMIVKCDIEEQIVVLTSLVRSQLLTALHEAHSLLLCTTKITGGHDRAISHMNMYKAIQWVSYCLCIYFSSSTAPSARGTLVSIPSFALDSKLPSSSLACRFSIVNVSVLGSVDLEHGE